MHIVGWWFYTPCKEAKETLDSVPNWLNFILVISTGAPSRESSFFSLYHSSTLSSSASAASVSLAPTRSMSTCYHRHIPTCDPSILSGPSHRSRSYRVPIHCAAMFCLLQMYSSIVWKPAVGIWVGSDWTWKAIKFLSRAFDFVVHAHMKSLLTAYFY